MITSAPCCRQNSTVNPVCGKFPAQLDRPFRLGGGRLLIAIDSHEHGDPREKMPCPLLAATLSAHGSAAFDVHVLAGLDGDAVEVAGSGFAVVAAGEEVGERVDGVEQQCVD